MTNIQTAMMFLIIERVYNSVVDKFIQLSRTTRGLEIPLPTN